MRHGLIPPADTLALRWLTRGFWSPDRRIDQSTDPVIFRRYCYRTNGLMVVIRSSGTFYTRDDAEYVADCLNTVMQLPNDEYAEVQLVSYDNGAEVPHEPIFIKFTDDPVFTVADGSEIAQCVTNDGRKVTIFFGKPFERQLQPAQIVIASESA